MAIEANILIRFLGYLLDIGLDLNDTMWMLSILPERPIPHSLLDSINKEAMLYIKSQDTDLLPKVHNNYITLRINRWWTKERKTTHNFNN